MAGGDVRRAHRPPDPVILDPELAVLRLVIAVDPGALDPARERTHPLRPPSIFSAWIPACSGSGRIEPGPWTAWPGPRRPRLRMAFWRAFWMRESWRHP